ncbi:RNase3 domain-containing protein [Clostridium tetanomorphum DSM 665]|uniref:Mini-ribonuclease 3 n=1 Tax=Clostridium tetanomorphum TaxID=1553 RepID=A0A923EDD5_CLOTT|nr:Mini-ribonuclease 3 [Clostridium tetanomorphum]KAJ52217.1 RNase3 domain-containing protein [Clostridium tetanomorphum DSM 665]MBC2399996.1 Mini-ribonuclease 3 [Clostridium tetanomorphum]NRZ95602.1 ribonuclease-3 family protein [Clostridium tetanomorphum]SQC00622.1 RNase3 domain-containing protein [Clostridium tetanomorphum]
MEINLFTSKFTLQEARALNPLVLAFIGDAVYEVFIRSYLIDKNRDMCVHKLHKKSVGFVKAHAQSEFIRNIQETLNEDEIVIFKRGRNAKSGTIPKNASVQDYRMATGFESVIGFLYLTNQKDRLNEILNTIINI